MKQKYYVTTPIYYINDIPHIGHTATTIAADIVARMHRQLGEEVFFLTGTDEHGQKVAETAAKEGLEVKEYCDKIAPRFEEAWKALNISNDFFIRTTNPKHENVVGQFLEKMKGKGDIYKGRYEGWYCIGCESFMTETELVDGHCPLHPPEKTIWREEDNWFFKLSAYVPKLIELIENNKTNYVYPEGKRSEVLAKLKAGVRDISISRENVEWGIPLPWDPKQTIYVWIDALINYYSATKIVPGKDPFWPADLHLLGKEILWFHTVIWQAMLMSADLPLPKRTYTHSFYMVDGQKMSKSLGNVISPGQLVDLFGVDGARYLIARSFPNLNDSDVGIGRFKETYNADLANNLGNLVSRVANLAKGVKVEEETIGWDKEITGLINEVRFDDAIRRVFDLWVNPTNAKINEVEPWKLAADDPKRVELMEKSIRSIRKAAFHLKPIMPEAAAKIEVSMGKEIRKIEGGLFPRIN